MAKDLTVEILKQIRDGIGSLKQDFNDRLDQTNQRLDQTNQRLDQTNQRLEKVDQRLERVEQGLLDLGQFMRQIALDQAKHERFHHHHVDLLEKDVRELQERVGKLEGGHRGA